MFRGKGSSAVDTHSRFNDFSDVGGVRARAAGSIQRFGAGIVNRRI